MNAIKKTTAAGIALAATAGLVAGPAMMAGQAWANGTITVANTDGDAITTGTYSVYQIFDATIADGKASEIKWADDSEAMRTAVCSVVIEGFDADNAPAINTTDDTTAQAAAEALAKITGTVGTTTNETTGKLVPGTPVDAETTLWTIAQNIRKAGIAATSTTANGIASFTNGGYFLVVGGATGTADQINTAPIYVAAESGNVTVTPKTALPKLTKDVKEQAAEDTAYAQKADATTGDKVTFRLTGELPGDLASYKTYQFNFNDSYDTTQFDVANDAVKVYADDVEVGNVTPSVNDATGEITVDIADVKALKTTTNADITVTATSKITVEYDATLLDGAHKDGTANVNTATITYSNDSSWSGAGDEPTGVTSEETADVYSYSLKVTKADVVSGDTINGDDKREADGVTPTKESASATFAIYDEAGTTLLRTVHTGTDGTADIEGLDAGTYLVKETKAPAGYQPAQDFKITIEADISADTKGDKITATSKFGQAARGDLTMNEPVTGFAGSFTVKDSSVVALPLTGMGGVTIGVVGGLVLVGIAGVAMARSRKNNKVEE